MSILLTASYYYSAMESGLNTMAETTAGFIEGYLSEDYKEFYNSCIELSTHSDHSDTVELQFIDRNGNLVASSFAQWSGYRVEESDVSGAIQSGVTVTQSSHSSRTGEHILAVSVPLQYSNGETIGVLRYVTSLRDADRQVRSIAVAIALAAILIGLFVVLGSRYFLRSILEPVGEITKTAKRIASGSYGSHIRNISNDEIGVLSEAINEMSDAISRTERLQSEFVSNVSHELRTPLTVITGWSETLLEMPDMPQEDLERGIGIIRSEAKRLTGMVEELLDFTRAQDGRMTLNVEKCDLRPQLEDTIFMYANKLKAEGFTLDYLDNDDDIPEISCDIFRLRQVFLNVLDNAMKHGGSGKRVTVEILRLENDISIRVRDFGPGIPEEELPFVKSKFYKGSSKARGNGIGLAVCEEIVRLHNGTLTLSNAVGGGTLVDIRLPVEDISEG